MSDQDDGMDSQRLIPVLGAPTASGKSAAAMALAESYPIEILSADAMQVYRTMDIGTAKPSPDERARVPHHLIDLVSPAEQFSVADWVVRAEGVVAEVLARGHIPLIVGGTGFYIRALLRGLPTVPAADPRVQEELWNELKVGGLDRLEEELRSASPDDAERAQRNPRRIIRAVEILRRTGRPPRDFPFTVPRHRYSLAVLEPAIAELRPRIEARTAKMFREGLVEEVTNLLQGDAVPLTAMQAIGYKEVARAISTHGNIEVARAEVLEATVRYARRQLTWFRREHADLRLPLLAQRALPQLGSWLARATGEELREHDPRLDHDSGPRGGG